ncbi:MAG TPA: chemotaxis protein CheW [Solimonas sp.]|nr:chemotaxis protein CheW [Solimonas sp.]
MMAARREDQVLSRWVCFELAGQLYGLPIAQVQEVLADSIIEPVPGTSELVCGVINLRGNVVTVVDLRRRFGYAANQTPQTRIVVVDHGSESIGLCVDRVADVRKLADGAIKPAPATGSASEAAGIRGVVSRSGELLTLLDLPTLLSNTPLLAA